MAIFWVVVGWGERRSRLDFSLHRLMGLISVSSLIIKKATAAWWGSLIFTKIPLLDTHGLSLEVIQHT